MSRTDIRLSNKDNTPYVLEVNPLPGLDPDESNLTLIAKHSGMSYKELINGILQSALIRHAVCQKDLKENLAFAPK
jgi:D-alanine-D-alanine ligase